MRLKLKPKIGDRRVVKRFAWLPKTMSNGTRIWLESYFSVEQYKEIGVMTDSGIIVPEEEWVEIHSEVNDELGDEAQIAYLKNRFFV